MFFFPFYEKKFTFGEERTGEESGGKRWGGERRAAGSWLRDPEALKGRLGSSSRFWPSVVAGPTGVLSTQGTGPPGEEPPPDGPSQGVRAGARLLCAQSSPDPSPRKARQRLGPPQPQSPLQGPPRPFVLLQGTGSRWVHLTLCPKGGPVGPAAVTAQLTPAECAGRGWGKPSSPLWVHWSQNACGFGAQCLPNPSVCL